MGQRDLEITFGAQPFGDLTLKVEDGVSDNNETRVSIPRDKIDDYSPEAIKTRQQFVKDFTGAELKHVAQYSLEPHTLNGNCEHFVGIAQIPLGIAGPIVIDGEHAKGEFLIQDFSVQ